MTLRCLDSPVNGIRNFDCFMSRRHNVKILNPHAKAAEPSTPDRTLLQAKFGATLTSLIKPLTVP